MPRPRTLATRAVAAVAFLVLLGPALTACVPGSSEAREFVQRYVDLIATADAEQLQLLWSTTITEDPELVRMAGDRLVDADERITVIEVGSPAPPDHPAGIPYSAKLDGNSQLAVPVRYSLAGAEHEATVIVARYARGYGDWHVVKPLMGTLGISQADRMSTGGVPTEITIAGSRLELDPGDHDGIVLYPASYRIERHSDPYLTSEPTQVTVLAAETATLPELPLTPTDVTMDRLRDSVLATFTECEENPYSCMVLSVVDLIDQHRHTAPDEAAWSFELITEPSEFGIDTDTGLLTFTGGELAIRAGGEDPLRFQFTGTAQWVIDRTTFEPAIIPTRIMIETMS